MALGANLTMAFLGKNSTVLLERFRLKNQFEIVFVNQAKHWLKQNDE